MTMPASSIARWRAKLRSRCPEPRNGFAVAAAACDLKLKRLTTAEAEALPDTHDENGARRLYLLMELARNRDDLDEQQRIVTEMETRFPQSQWLAEALFSSGNMYLLRRDYPKAVEYYSYLAAHFPQNKNAAAAHWRAGWLSYRQGLYADAARLFDEQIQLYPDATETAAALYWRGRLYETQDHKPAQAAANYRTIVRAYQHFFYAQMARERLAALGNTQPASKQPQLEQLPGAAGASAGGELSGRQPASGQGAAAGQCGPERLHSRRRLPPIRTRPRGARWPRRRSMPRMARRFAPCARSSGPCPTPPRPPFKSIPLAYWRILFPEPYWETIKAESAKNNLDPYLVASLIRQESEFNPSAISYANAYGLMQLLPSSGRALAREEGMSHFETFQLLDPGDQHSPRNALSAPDAGQVWRSDGVRAGRLQRGRQSRGRLAGRGTVSRHRRVRGVHSVHADTRVC